MSEDEVQAIGKRGEICFRKIVDRFGEAVVGTDGELDRKKLGEIVFSDEGKRKIRMKLFIRRCWIM